MAKPRFFVSSTYYDLKVIRSDLEIFLQNMGYDPVLNERGHIPYGNKEKLEEYCYKEIQMCDVLLSIIGGRYGTKSAHEGDTISQHELRTALELGKQVFIFVDKTVKSEHRFYAANKDNPDTKYTAVDNKKVFEILDFIDTLPLNNATFSFETAQDIILFLKEQLAGLFKNLLIESSRVKEVMLFKDLKENVSTLKQLVAVISKDQAHRQERVSEILILQHPAFAQLKKTLKIAHRVVFLGMADFRSLVGAYGYKAVDEMLWDKPNMAEFERVANDKVIEYLRVSTEIFDKDSQLKIFDPVEWNDSWITFTKVVSKQKESPGDDEPPF